MDLIDRKAVGLGLRLCHDLKDPFCQLFYLIGRLQAVDDRVNVVQIAMDMCVGVYMIVGEILAVLLVNMLSMRMIVVFVSVLFMAMAVHSFLTVHMIMVLVSVVFMNVPFMAVLSFFFLQMDIKIIRVDAAFYRPSKMQMIAIHLKTCQCLLQYCPVCS